jgi:DNA polymerase III subunit delta'
MKFAEVVGHESAIVRLRRLADDARVPGAVLLLGPAGVGKRRLADAFATRLLCEAPVAGDACGVCGQCTRVAAGTHPDLRVVTRAEDRRDVRIEQVRELSRWLAQTPMMAGRKIAIIDGAHDMNEHGQNALLKTLEEPPGASVLVLTASAAALLLPTVRSRCQLVRLHPLPADAVARVLEAAGLPAERARRLVALAEGSPGAALALESDDAARARDAVLEALPRLGTLGAAEVSALANEIARGGGEAALATIVAWYRDALAVALLGAETPLRHAEVAAVHATAARLSAPALLRQLEAVCDTIDGLGRNANRMLALETMLLCLRENERGGRASLPAESPWTTSP